MKYCSFCGAQISDDAHYCQSCGKNVSSVTQSNREERKEEYAGKIIKCPNCEGQIGAFEAKCPYCGYEIRDGRASDAIERFSKGLDEIQKSGLGFTNFLMGRNGGRTKRVANYILNYPIPNTKEDLLEFFVLTTSNINIEIYSYDKQMNHITAADEVINEAWIMKSEQLYQKVCFTFGMNDEFLAAKKIFEEKKNAVEKEKRKTKRKKLLILIGALTAFILLLPASCFFGPDENASTEKNTISEAASDVITEKINRIEFDVPAAWYREEQGRFIFYYPKYDKVRIVACGYTQIPELNGYDLKNASEEGAYSVLESFAESFVEEIGCNIVTYERQKNGSQYRYATDGSIDIDNEKYKVFITYVPVGDGVFTIIELNKPGIKRAMNESNAILDSLRLE